MISLYPRLFRSILFLLSFLSIEFTWAQQVFPVLATLQINPPYSLYLNDYSAPGSDKMQVRLFLKDLTKNNYPCYLRFKLEGFGITIQNKNNFSVQPIYLNAGELSTFSGSDLEPYFNPKNLVFQGLDQAAFSRNGGKLLEGVYRVSVEVLDYYQHSVVSNAGSTVLSVFLSYPPIINSPLPFSKVQALEPQNVLFQWVPRHTGSIDAAYNVAYNFRLVELIPPERDPNDAMRSTKPLFETYTDQTILLYGPAEPALIPGNSYAVQVQALEAEGKDIFINNGNSEVVKFTYGDKCAPPVSILAELADANSLKFSWSALPLQQAFSIRYREANNPTAEWFEQESYTPQYTAQGLRPGHTYEYQVKAQCMNGYGDYTALQQFQMPDEKFTQGDFVCGKQSPAINLDKTQLLDLLLSGNVFTAGDFSVTVTSLTASQNGVFSGVGTITVPVLSNLQFSVIFNDISINSKYQMVDGIVKVGVQGLDTVPQENGLKQIISALSELSDALDDLLKELKKDKPDPEILKQKAESISSNISSWPKTNDESLQLDIEGVRTLVGSYNTSTAWVGLDNPATKDAAIADLVKVQEKTKEINKKAGDLEEEKSKDAKKDTATVQLDAKKLADIFPGTPKKRLEEVANLINKYSDKFEINTPLRMADFLGQVGYEADGFTKIPVEGSCYRASSIIGTFKGQTWQDPKNLEAASRGSYKCPDFRNGQDELPNKYICKDEKGKTVNENAGENLFNYTYRSEFGNGLFSSGDGYQYRGRGIIQLTWKSSYIDFNDWLRSAKCNCPDYKTTDVVKNPDLLATDNDLAVLSAMWFWKSRGLNALADNKNKLSEEKNSSIITKKINSKELGKKERFDLSQKIKKILK